ncbi:MAG: DUF1697 domain-containing protein [Homoserinimonas sp.]|nr:DUF1697 domain-containing protein [Homoserinimonas sp.]MCW5945289.1 DUF1697 domain-containing protein [Cryobacterium sp.]
MSDQVRFVLLLRGVNVGGVAIRNSALQSVLEAACLTQVRPVLASGNALFSADADLSQVELESRVREALLEGFGFRSAFVVKPQSEVGEIAGSYPFPRSDEDFHPYVVFSATGTFPESLLEATVSIASELDLIEAGETVIYWRVPKGNSLDSPFAKLLARREFADGVTTRNLRTIEKLSSG